MVVALIAGAAVWLLANPIFAGALMVLLGGPLFGLVFPSIQLSLQQMALFFAGLFVFVKFVIPAWLKKSVPIEKAIIVTGVALFLVLAGAPNLLHDVLGFPGIKLSVVP